MLARVACHHDPVLQGRVVALRAVERADLPVLHALSNELETIARGESDPPSPMSLARLEAVYEQRASAGDPLPRFVVDVGGTVVGECMLHTFDELARTAHVGIALLRDHWGKGYGTDAVTTLVAYAFVHRNLRKVCLEVLADDPRAVGAYRRAGFVEEGRFREQAWFDGAYVDVLRMAVLRPDR